MDRITALEKRLDNLQRAFEQSQRNQTPITAKAEEGANGVKTLTPYTASATAYIDDTQVTFSNVPEGNVTVFMTDGDGKNVSHTVEYVNGNVVVMFEKRESLATVNISIS